AFTAPMSRQDMADYLGLTIETVSRVISQMKRQGKLRLLSTNRMVLVNDHLDDDAQRHLTHTDANVFSTAV
ncbi:MAG: helix-turn-helix domain-containing protein, partial [Pseudomonadota bacterium]